MRTMHRPLLIVHDLCTALLQGYYRGVNTSTPRIYFTVTGSSAFASQFAYRTYLLPGSRPSAVPCHPLASSCSVADLEAVDNITVTGVLYYHSPLFAHLVYMCSIRLQRNIPSYCSRGL
jgi:hypothetical protein